MIYLFNVRKLFRGPWLNPGMIGFSSAGEMAVEVSQIATKETARSSLPAEVFETKPKAGETAVSPKDDPSPPHCFG